MTVRISVDHEKCMGHARCNFASPDLFELDDNGYVDVSSATTVDDSLRGAAYKGASACPERAISISSD